MKLKNSHLLIIFIVLLVAILFINHQIKKDTGTLKMSFFDIENDQLSEMLTKISVFPQFDETKSYNLIRKDSIWFLQNKDGSLAETESDLVQIALREIDKLKPSRLLSEKKEDWEKYGVDSSGTLLLFQAEDKEFRIILGEEGFQDQVRINTYCRVPSETNTYAVEAYFRNSFKEKKHEWRKKVLFDLEKAYWAKIQSDYNDTIRIAQIMDQKWFLENKELDSSEIFGLLSTVEKFIKLPATEITDPGNPVLKLQVENFDNSINNRLTFYKSQQLWIVSSGINQGNYFIAKNEDIDLLLNVLGY